MKLSNKLKREIYLNLKDWPFSQPFKKRVPLKSLIPIIRKIWKEEKKEEKKR